MPLLFALGLAVAFASAIPLAAHPVIGDPAPALPQRNLRALPRPAVAAPITVVEFFATWCRACQASLRDTVEVLNSLDQGPGQPSFKLVIVDVAEDEASVAQWFGKAELFRNTVIAIDADKRAYARWGANRLPTVFVLDNGSTIRHINRGHGKGYRERLTTWLRKRMASAQ